MNLLNTRLFNIVSASAFALGLTLLETSLAFAEGAGGGALGGKGGSGPEPSALAFLAVATGVGGLIARRRKGAAQAQDQHLAQQPHQGEEG